MERPRMYIWNGSAGEVQKQYGGIVKPVFKPEPPKEETADETSVPAQKQTTLEVGETQGNHPTRKTMDFATKAVQQTFQ